MSNQDLTKFKVPAGFRGKGVLYVQLWWFVQATLFAASPQVFYGWRRFLLRVFGAKIGKNVIIRSSVKITYPWKLKVGDYSWIGDNVDLYTLGEIDIGSNSVISQRCYLCTGGHDYTAEGFDIFQSKIIVKNSCWVATDVFVSPGVTINEGCVVGARSSVFNDLPENSICVGSPARKIKDRY